MIDRLVALSGPQEWLAYVGIVSVLIGMASILMQSVVKAPISKGPSLAFRTAFILVFARIVYRLIGGGAPLSYGAVVIYAAPAIACLWTMVDTARYQRLVRREAAIKLAHHAATEAERTAELLRIAADGLRTKALERTAENTERTAIATEAIQAQADPPLDPLYEATRGSGG